MIRKKFVRFLSTTLVALLVLLTASFGAASRTRIIQTARSQAQSPSADVLSECFAVHKVTTADSLRELADFYLGDIEYAPAILLATNARAGSSTFSFIGNPEKLGAGTTLCIPEFQEAERLRSRFETYLRAVSEMVLPRPSGISNSLVSIDPLKPVHVVAWVRSDQIQKFKAATGTTPLGNEWASMAPYDLWVTVAPNLKSFCQDFNKGHGGDVTQLNLRLEQRLGLPPGSAKTAFIEIVLADPSKTTNLFRPCTTPETNTSTCSVGPPANTVDEKYRNWVYTQYYMSYAVAQPSQYPWTSLGYTFDWATSSNGTNGREFVRFGESEFVIPKGAAIEVRSVSDTSTYCSSK